MDQPESSPQNNHKKTVRFCINNPRNLQERQQLLDKGYQSRDCLGNCTRCFETRFLEINEEQIEGETYQQIIDSTKIE